MDIAKFRQILQSRDLPARFKIDIYIEDISSMLRECYIDEVVRRGDTFQNDKDTNEHIDKAAKWLTGDFKPGLMLSGTVGNGKTTLVRAISRLIYVMYGSNSNYTLNKNVRQVTALELSDMAKQNPEMFQSIKNNQLLAIDDVGVEPALVKNWGNEISPLTEVIYHRYEKQLFTIITSNLNPEDMGKRYGERISDRLTGMFDRIAFENKTYRK